MTSHRRRIGRSVSIVSMLAASALAVGLVPAVAGASAKAHHHSAKAALSEAIVIAYTGPVSFEGANADAGVYPAVSEINADGGILGHKVNIITDDTKGDPADAVPLVDKLIATGSNVIGVSGVGTASGPTIVPLLNNAQLPMFSFAGEAAFDQSKYKYFWRLLPPDDANGKAMDLYAKSLHATKVATVFGTTTGAQGDLPGVLSGLKATHEKVVKKLTLTPDQPSYRAEVEQLVSAHPQVIFTEQNASTAVTFFSELKQLGHMIPVIGTAALVTSTWENSVRKAIGKATMKKYITILSTVTVHKTQATKAYKKALSTVKSKVLSPWTQWVGAAHSEAAYDGMIIQALAMTASHSTKPQVYNKHIKTVTNPGKHKKVVHTYAQGVKALKAGKKIRYVGASGPIDFNKYNNSFGSEEALRINTHDSGVPIKKIPEKKIQAIGG